ncbi:class I SAM-dependent methyltransferase [Polaromonas sp.]|uniref:class I SAM-dependent methyltransferase n=1 Tax=Polaromonas sp. TaxID=1869339 RepID=UPI0037529944
MQLSPDVVLPELHADIARYYTAKVRTHGATPEGVDWGCVPTQELRFVQLLRVCDFTEPLSINDLGCGYGALLGFLRKRHRRSVIDYLGIDLSPAMVDQAKQLWRRYQRAAFTVGLESPRVADYSVASGLFNVQQDQPAALWALFVQRVLTGLLASSRKGFAINFLAPLSRDMQPKRGLYRTAPDIWMEYCARTLGLQPELLTGYGLNEFTLLVRREPPQSSD